jgi:uncharacterized protein
MPPAISALYTYPIKSCGGLSHDLATLDARGLAFERRWMVTDPSGEFITLREVHRMALVQPSLSDEMLTVRAPSMPDLHLPIDGAGSGRREVVVWQDRVTALDEGDDAARWFSEALGVQARLVRMPEDSVRPTSTKYTANAGQVGFSDGYPLLFISEASLTDLNDRLTRRGKQPVPMARFRPNVVIRDTVPYAEDWWHQVEIAGVPFEVVKPCARCVMTSVDPATGLQPDAHEPLATLASYRRTERGAMFGQNVIHRGLGVLRVGDSLKVLA